MSDAKKYATIFRAAADGVGRTLPWKQYDYLSDETKEALQQLAWCSQPYTRSDYAAQEGAFGALDGIARVFEKMAEAERVTP